MFEISELKAKTLAELQGIAKSIGLTKTSQLKKLDLVYQILDTQAANPSKAKAAATPKKEETEKTEKPKRKRVLKKSSTGDNAPNLGKTQTAENPEVTTNIAPVEKTADVPVTERTKPNPRPQRKPLVKKPVKTEDKKEVAVSNQKDEKQEQKPANQPNKTLQNRNNPPQRKSK